MQSLIFCFIFLINLYTFLDICFDFHMKESFFVSKKPIKVTKMLKTFYRHCMWILIMGNMPVWIVYGPGLPQKQTKQDTNIKTTFTVSCPEI